MCIPSFRTQLAIQRGVEKNILLKTWGGLGDQICAEPTLRFALKTFKECKVSLASECPELFSHLNFHEVFDLKKVQPVYENYLTFNTITPINHLEWEFMSHMITNCVDYPSLSAFRCQLPVKDKEIFLKPMPKGTPYYQRAGVFERFAVNANEFNVCIHPGRHWQSKTFPKSWWDKVIQELVAHRFTPLIIGADTDDNRGTVDVDTAGCIDLRNQLSVAESIWILQRAHVLLTNDSSPLHMAASQDPDDKYTGNTWIGYVATCKHPDYISHWRKGQWSWRMFNFGKGGIWDHISYCPNTTNEISAENVGDLLMEWLPDPSDLVKWTYNLYLYLYSQVQTGAFYNGLGDDCKSDLATDYQQGGREDCSGAQET